MLAYIKVDTRRLQTRYAHLAALGGRLLVLHEVLVWRSAAEKAAGKRSQNFCGETVGWIGAGACKDSVQGVKR